MTPYGIILADDHTLVRRGIKKIICENPGLSVIGEAADGVEALELVEQLQPDLVILDVQMPRMNGLDTARHIKERWPEVKILVLTMHREEAYLRQAQDTGVDGFVLKEDVDEVLVSAIDAIRRGQTFTTPLMCPD
jgi:DNA-binding NarL/FixJ family response regulator